MSLEALTWVWANSPYKGGALLVHLALADYAGEGGESWPTVDTLAGKARLSKRRTQEILKEMEDDGAITREMSSGRYEPNKYRLMGAKTAPLDPPRGAADRAAGVRPASPKPSVEPSSTTPPPSPPPSPARGKESLFQQFRTVYPARLNNDQRWKQAKGAFNARLKEGFTGEQIVAAAESYATAIRAEGREGTRLVKQAATFLGDAANIHTDWRPSRNGRPAQPARPEDYGEATTIYAGAKR